jgi:hypothetical protein
LDSLEGLLVDLFECLLDLPLFVQSLLPFGFTAHLLVSDQVDLHDLVILDNDVGLGGGGRLPVPPISLAVRAIHLHLSLHYLIIFHFQIILLVFDYFTLLSLVSNFQLQSVICLHQCLDLVLQVSVLPTLLLLSLFQLPGVICFLILLFFQEFGHLLLQALPCFL